MTEHKGLMHVQVYYLYEPPIFAIFEVCHCATAAPQRPWAPPSPSSTRQMAA